MNRPRPQRDSFHRSLQRINYTRQRMEKLFDSGKITKTDLESVYEALFLRAVTSFEVFLEDLFLAILEGKIQYSQSRVQPRLQVRSRDALMEILLQGNDYMNWLPFKHTMNRAKLYLKDGRPFSELSNGDM